MPSHNPAAGEIKAARDNAGLTLAAAAAIVHSSPNSWHQWETGKRQMHAAMWELFCIKTRNDPVVLP